jgi:hypothetical protein
MARVIIQQKAADNIKVLIKSAVENQLNMINWGIIKTKRKLEELEKESEMDSKTFYEEFVKGNMGDDIKYIRWAGEYETLAQLEKDYNDLQEIELC